VHISRAAGLSVVAFHFGHFIHFDFSAFASVLSVEFDITADNKPLTTNAAKRQTDAGKAGYASVNPQ
jgi:hypothetical protein